MRDNIGRHGWVVPRSDGVVARCGGPGMCAHCQREKAQLDADAEYQSWQIVPPPPAETVPCRPARPPLPAMFDYSEPKK